MTAHFVITPNGELLRYPTVALAKAMWIDQTVVYTSPRQLEERHTLDGLNYLARRVDAPCQSYSSKEVAAEQLFPLLCLRASPHNPRSKSRFARKNGTLIPEHPRDKPERIPSTSLRLHFASPKMFDEMCPKLATQAYVLGRYLAQHCPKDGYTLDGVAMDVSRAHDENVLRTRQSPDRIFRYYADTMVELGLLAYTDDKGRPCDRPRNKRFQSNTVVRHPLDSFKGDLTNATLTRK